MDAKNAYIVFTDLKGFSKLSEPEIRIFYSEVLPELASKIIHLKEESLVWNTWGDALVAIFEDETKIIELVFTYRDFFKNYDFKAKNINPIFPRIAGHFGRFEIIKDALLGGTNNAFGQNINTTARIEPITRPNEIYVTEDFKDRIEKSPNNIDINFDELGEIPLAKNFGTYNLFRLRKKDEDKKIIDRIVEQDLSKMLPEAEAISKDEIETLKYLANSPSIELFKKNLDLDKLISDEVINENYLLKNANLCKNFGLYEEALQIINKIKKQTRDIDGIDVVLYKYQKEVMKTETNCLTRLGKYDEASNLIYGVWQLNNKDSDTLSMLAAQYKRRALYTEKNILLDKENINSDLLKRALSLYIEAFRLDIEDYYPAINIAYLYKIIGGIEEGKGIKFANYISSTWKHEKSKDWWIDSTLLECEIISSDFFDLDKNFNEIIELHKPNYFQKKSTYTQIELYSHLVGRNEVIDKILNLLKG
ncbi:MAG: adenylate/guanylate cyclase domain-containing protein [Sulfurimonas sp.]|jgi:tetratricopeptide (TPR) repeat protein